MPSSAILYYVSLCYKLHFVGIAAVFFMLCMIPFMRIHRSSVFSAMAILSILYTALCTVTAVQFNVFYGVVRAFQFITMSLAGIAFANYMYSATNENKALFLKCFTIVTALILSHVVIYHLSTGRLISWKHLYDTKLVFSTSPCLLFFYQSDIRRKIGDIAFWAILSVLVLFVLLSGERKAYLLVTMGFLFSASSVTSKATLMMLAGTLASFFIITAEPGDYVSRQLTSFVESEAQEYSYSDLMQEESLGYRSDLARKFANENGKRLFQENPLFGVGASGYQAWAYEKFGRPDQLRLTGNIHGEIHRLPAENGIVGVVIAALYFLTISILVAKYVLRRGGLASNSRVRGILIVYSMLLIYAGTEALDSTLITLILFFGMFVAVESRKDAIGLGAKPATVAT